MSIKILIIGACGQIGTELTQKLRAIHGTDNVIASDIRKLNIDVVNSGPFEVINALDFNQIEHLVEKHQIDDVYLMAALLSATAEKNPAFAWDLNMNSCFSASLMFSAWRCSSALLQEINRIKKEKTTQK